MPSWLQSSCKRPRLAAHLLPASRGIWVRPRRRLGMHRSIGSRATGCIGMGFGVKENVDDCFWWNRHIFFFECLWESPQDQWRIFPPGADHHVRFTPLRYSTQSATQVPVAPTIAHYGYEPHTGMCSSQKHIEMNPIPFLFEIVWIKIVKNQ